MSTLSELFPSGGTQNNIEFVAQETLANGQTVGLRSDGKIEAIVETPVSQSLGAEASFGSGNFQRMASVYDAAADRYIVSYAQFDNAYTYLVVCNNTGATLSFGTPVTISTNSYSNAALAYDADVNKTVVSYADGGNSYYGTARVVIVSGDTITLGAASVYVSLATSDTAVASTYHVASARVITAFNVITAATDGRVIAIKATASNTVGFGTAVEFCPSNADQLSITYGASSVSGNRFNIAFRDTGTNNWPRMITGTVSGSAITLAGSDNIDQVSQSTDTSVAYSTENDYYVFCYRDSNVKARAVKLGSNGRISAYGAVITLQSGAMSELGSVYDPINKVVYVGVSSTSNVNYYTLSVSSTGTLTASSATALRSSNTGGVTLAYSSEKQRILFSYGYTQFFSRALTLAGASTNVSSYIGITNAAISSGATGEVAVKGGLSTGGNVLPYSLSFGTAATFDGGTIYQRAVAFDSNSNKVVIAYRDNSNSDYGTAIVGTVSGTAISFGSEVVFEAADSRYTTAVFDSNSNKVVIGYSDYGNSQYGTAIVGTVSGTSISFGTPVIYESAPSRYQASTFDTSSNKVVIAYQDNGNSNYGTAVVGTVSGTSVSFGSPVVYEAGDVQGQGAGFDSTNNKVVIAYRDGGNSGYGTAIVGTVSGTSISFGTAVVYEAANSNGASVTYDSTAQKIVISYTDTGASTANAIVGTVSGTSISFGSPVVFSASSIYGSSVIYDTSQNKIVISYGSVSSGKSLVGTVNGTTISFGTATTFSAAATGEVSAVYDSSTNKTVTTFALTTGYAGKAIVGSLANTLTIGSTYYVQDDGTLATTSSSTKAGKAISTTALNLVDPT